MPLTLEQYATYLDSRDLLWPLAPAPERPKAKPHLVRLPDVRAVVWNVYGTLLAISDGILRFDHPDPIVYHAVLEKTLEEFKMWGSMARKPGQPGVYLKDLYHRAIDEQKLLAGSDPHQEIVAERIWENIVKKLMQRDYHFDTGFYGSLNEYCRKIAYFFHASLQGTACYETAAATCARLHERGVQQGIFADGQCFSFVQLSRGLKAQQPSINPEAIFSPKLRVFSADKRVKKPAPTLTAAVIAAVEAAGLAPHEVLHVGSSLPRDIKPARQAGMRTALFAGDRASLVATPEQLKDPQLRPDLLITQLDQLVEVVG